MSLVLVKQKLTDALVAEWARTPAASGQRAFLWDAEVARFGVVKTDKGAVSFCYQYRFGGKSKRLTIKAASVDAARAVALRFASELNSGRDPGAAPEQLTAGKTLRQMAEDYFARRDFASRTAYRQTLERDVYPYLGHRLYDSIVTSDLVALKERVIAKHSSPGLPAGHHAAAQALKVLRTIWSKYGCERVRDGYSWPRVVSPTQDLPRNEENGGRDLSPAEIKSLWQASEHCGLYGQYVRMLFYTGMRRTACATLRVEQLMPNGILRIAGSKTKPAYELPLSGPALALLASLKRDGCPFFFSLDGEHPIRNYGWIKGAIQARARLNSPWHIHLIRHSVRSILEGLTSPDIARLCVGHARTGMDRVYVHNPLTAQVRAAMEALAERLHEIAGG
jgi:integrase